MTTSELIVWLRDNSSGVYRPAREAADKIERMDRALRHLAECNLSEANCADFDVANARVRNIALAALK